MALVGDHQAISCSQRGNVVAAGQRLQRDDIDRAAEPGLPTAVTGAEARHRTIEAVEARVSGSIRMLILEWILNDAVTIQVTASPGHVPSPR
jgi:hypothetical protein